MINNEQKKWFLYSNLPTAGLNKLFVYMPTKNCPECEKALWELEEYLSERSDTIAKVSRVDTRAEKMMGRSHFPKVVFESEEIYHDLHDLVKKVDNYIPKYEFNSELNKKLKALKDGKDLL